jgi:hypothetical protein
MSGNILVVITGCYWQLVGRSQGCCEHCRMASMQMSSPQRSEKARDQNSLMCKWLVVIRTLVSLGLHNRKTTKSPY